MEGRRVDSRVQRMWPVRTEDAPSCWGFLLSDATFSTSGELGSGPGCGISFLGHSPGSPPCWICCYERFHDVEHVNDVLLLDHLTHAADGTEGSTAAAPISKHRVKR